MAPIQHENLRSSLYRRQIENLSLCMKRFVSETLLKPLHNMAAFNGVEKAFSKTETEAYENCSDLDMANSGTDEDSALSNTIESMTELVHLKNDARTLISKDALNQQKETR